MINLNESTFDGGSNVQIFNNGTAGVVENVKLSLVKKTKDDKENAPDYKVVFTDSLGANVNMSFWYVSTDTEYNTIEEQVQKQGKVLKHLIHSVYDSGYDFPSFANATAMLDGVMKLLKEGLGDASYRVFSNYGSTYSVKQYIQIRSWVPFIEPISTPLDKTRLSVGNIDAMERLVEDSVLTENGTEAVTADGDDW